MSEPLVCGVLTVTPTHCGTGQAAAAIDLPIAREQHTGLPVLPASMLKGVLRDWFRAESSTVAEDLAFLFGPEPPRRANSPTQPNEATGQKPQRDTPHAGALMFFEGQLLAIPVRSLTGVFRWVTAPILIHRLRRILTALGSSLAASLSCPEPKERQFLLPSGQAGPVSLEDLVYPAERCQSTEDVDRLADLLGRFVAANPEDPERQDLASRLVVVPDPVLVDLAQRATAVTARIVLDPETKTSQNLWYEELLPPDTLFAVVVASRPGTTDDDSPDPTSRFLSLLEKHGRIQNRQQYGFLGGNVSVGQGLVRWLFGVQGAES